MEDQIVKQREEKLLNILTKHVVPVGNKYYVNHFLVDIPISVHLDIKSTNNSIVNMNYRHHRSMYNKMMKNSDYKGVSILVNKPYRLQWFYDNYKKIYQELGEKDYYSLLRSQLTQQEFHYYSKDFFPLIIKHGKNPLLMMDKEELIVYKKLPEEFIVYRGISSEKSLNKNQVLGYIGNSWTLNREMGIRFSKELLLHSVKGGYYYLFSYKVLKSEVISYFNQRDEDEIFLDLTKFDYEKVIIEKI